MVFSIAYAWSILPNLLVGALVTLQATVGGILISIIVGAVLTLMRGSQNVALNVLGAAYMNFVRCTPLLAQLFFLFYVLPRWGITIGGLTTGIIALGLHYGAYTCEAFRASIESVPRAQLEASLSLGHARWQTWWRIVVPQALPLAFAMTTNYMVGMFKESALLAFITVNELFGVALGEASITYRYFEPIIMVGLIFFVMSNIISFFSSKMGAWLVRYR